MAENTLTFEDVVQAIADMLTESDGEYVAEVYNSISSRPIKYLGDSVWEELPEPQEKRCEN